MSNPLSLDSIDKVHIPELDNESKEEQLFEVSEAASHNEHKLVEAQECALNVAKQRIRTLEIQNDDLAMLGPHRRQYSWWILGFVILFVIATFTVLLLSAIHVAVPENSTSNTQQTLITLDNEVLITLLATNTVQVVGLLYVVAKWLFPTLSPKPTEKNTPKK